MPKLRIASTVCVLCLIASFASAHAGHGTTQPASLLHLLEADHVSLALFAAAAVLSIGTLVRRSRRT